MVRRLGLCLVLLVLVAAPSARASGGVPFAAQGGAGVVAPGGLSRWVAVGDGASTVIEQVRIADGTVLRSTSVPGEWGIPMVTNDGLGGGLSRDGGTLVLAGTGSGYPSLFLAFDTRLLSVTRTISLNGWFGFDALSPYAARMYLIRYVSSSDLNHYVVRAYDLRTGRLLPGRIADRTQRTWVMQGMPTTRVTDAGGRWVYTLYDNPGGYPFVHALDTVRGVAHCIGLPWTGSENAVWNMRLALTDGGRTLAVHWRSGRPWLTVATGTWRIAYVRGGFPWRWPLLGAGVAVALLVAAALLLRRRLRQEVDEQPRDELRLAQGEVVV
jgi:hypothetical protein